MPNTDDVRVAEAQRTRTYRLTGSYNFRDIGGYATTSGQTVRWGRVFRSDALHLLDQQDLEHLRPLGIQTIVDLRSRREIEMTGPGLLHSEPGIAVVHVPFGRLGEEAAPDYQPPTLGELYAGIIDEAKASIGTVLTTLAGDGVTPAVVHCAVGKDRTGISIATLLRLLGVPDETIIADYLLTAENQEQWRRRQPSEILERFPHVAEGLLRVDADVMTTTLATIDRDYGGTEAFARAAGVNEATTERLRATLLEPER